MVCYARHCFTYFVGFFFSLNSYTKHKVGTVITSICPEGETEPKVTKRET